MTSILYLAHALPPEEYTGTPIVAHGYASGMARRGWRVGVVYTSSAAPGLPDGIPADEGFERYPVAPSQTNGLLWSIEAATRPFGDDSRETAVFRDILTRLRPEVLHVVDNVTLPLEWPELAHAAGIPVVRTVSRAEDICGLMGLVSPCSNRIGYCDAPVTPDRCASCVEAELDRWGQPPVRNNPRGEPWARAAQDLSAELLRSRAVRLRRALSAKRARATYQFGSVFQVAVFAAAAWRDFFEATLPLDPRRVRVIEMGLDLKSWPPNRTRRQRQPDQPVVFEWVTAFDAARGVHDVVDAFSDPALVERSDYRLRIHGGGDLRLVSPLLEANPRVEYCGPFEVGDLPAILGQSDAGLSTSLFETFHRVTREYLLAGLPVVINPTFGTHQLIRHGHNGLVYEHARQGSLVEAVTMLLDDPALEARLAEGASTTHVRSSDEELDELDELYQSLLR